MKKIYFIFGVFAALMFIAPFVQAQRMSFISKQDKVTGVPADKHLKSFFNIKNESNDSLWIGLRFKVKSITGNHMYANCIGMCSEPTKTDAELAFYVPLAGGETMSKYIHRQFLTFDIYVQILSEEFEGDLSEGITEIEIIAYDKDNPSDQISYLATYEVGGTSVDAVSTAILQAFPNPAANEVSVEIPKGGNIEIYNALGVKVAEQNAAQAGICHFSTIELTNGLYFIRLIEDGKVIGTHNFVVNR